MVRLSFREAALVITLIFTSLGWLATYLTLRIRAEELKRSAQALADKILKAAGLPYGG